MIYQSKFETKHFIINLPKFYWIGKISKNNNKPFFAGIPIANNGFKKEIFPEVHLFDFDNITLKALEIFCDKSLEKSTQKINNWEAEIYTCITKSRSDLMDKHIVYKDEVFHIFYYTHDINAFENFQKEYDKFFEGVRLKE
jgi:hypothetical protein